MFEYLFEKLKTFWKFCWDSRYRRCLWSIICLFMSGCFDSLMGSIKAVVFFCKTGNNSTTKLSVTKSKRHEGEQRTVREVLLLCLVFGALYFSAIFVFDNYFLGHFIKFLTSFLTPDDDYYYWWFSTICRLQFNLCWTFFLFLLSRILTYSWYQEIADLTYAKIGMKSSSQQSLSYALSDQINSAITQFLFFVQANIVYIFELPVMFQCIIYLFHLSLLYALYAFEYKWIQKGYNMNLRLSYVEAKWPYFVGFGLPLSILTCWTGSFVHSMCVFTIIFPFNVMSSTITHSNSLKTFNCPLRVFKIVTGSSDYLVTKIINEVLKFIR